MHRCFLSQNAEQAHFTSQEAKDAYSRMIRKKKVKEVWYSQPVMNSDTA